MSSVVISPPLVVVAHLRLSDSREGLLRLLAVCHRRMWRVTAISARTAGSVTYVELDLTLPRGDAQTVERQLAKLVEVSSVEARDRA